MYGTFGIKGAFIFPAFKASQLILSNHFKENKRLCQHGTQCWHIIVDKGSSMGGGHWDKILWLRHTIWPTGCKGQAFCMNRKPISPTTLVYNYYLVLHHSFSPPFHTTQSPRPVNCEQFLNYILCRTERNGGYLME